MAFSSSLPPSISHSSSADMAALEVNLNLLLQLQAMDFSFARAARALHSTRTTIQPSFMRNASVEEAVNWIIDHESDPFIDQAPSVTFDIDIESSSSFNLSEELRKKTKMLMERVQKNEAQEERHHQEERRRTMEPVKEKKEEKKSSREKIPQKLEQDKAERQSKVELLNERPEPIKSPLTSSLPSTMSSKKAECMRECLKSLKQNYKERVGSLKGGIEFLEHCGFERIEGGFLYLPPHKVDVNSLKSAGFLLNSALSNPFFGVLSP